MSGSGARERIWDACGVASVPGVGALALVPLVITLARGTVGWEPNMPCYAAVRTSTDASGRPALRDRPPVRTRHALAVPCPIVARQIYHASQWILGTSVGDLTNGS